MRPVSLKEPFEVFQKGFNGVKEVIRVGPRSLFTKEANRCVFEREEECKRLKQEKDHLDSQKNLSSLFSIERGAFNFLRAKEHRSGDFEN